MNLNIVAVIAIQLVNGTATLILTSIIKIRIGMFTPAPERPAAVETDTSMNTIISPKVYLTGWSGNVNSPLIDESDVALAYISNALSNSVMFILKF